MTEERKEKEKEEEPFTLSFQKKIKFKHSLIIVYDFSFKKEIKKTKKQKGIRSHIITRCISRFQLNKKRCLSKDV